VVQGDSGKWGWVLYRGAGRRKIEVQPCELQELWEVFREGRVKSLVKEGTVFPGCALRRARTVERVAEVQGVGKDPGRVLVIRIKSRMLLGERQKMGLTASAWT